MLPKRRVVERTFIWSRLSRQYGKEYERPSETTIYGAMSWNMPRAPDPLSANSFLEGGRGVHEDSLGCLFFCPPAVLDARREV